MTIRHYNDYRKPGNNMYIYRNDEDMTNIYDSDWFQLIFNGVVDLLKKESV